MLFSGTLATADVAFNTAAGLAAGAGDGAVLLATGAERRENKYPPTASAATIMTAAAIIQLRLRLGFSAATGTAAALCRAWRNFCGTSGLPSSSVYRFTTDTREPCFTSTSPRSCRCFCQ